jgi:hypothetical protein
VYCTKIGLDASSNETKKETADENILLTNSNVRNMRIDAESTPMMIPE